MTTAKSRRLRFADWLEYHLDRLEAWMYLRLGKPVHDDVLWRIRERENRR